MKLLQLLETTRRQWTHKDITPEIVADIQATARYVHDEEGCDVTDPEQVGYCALVAEILENKYGWETHSGFYLSQDGLPIGDHVWNVLSDGTIVDSTPLQWHEGHNIRIIPPSDPNHKRYRYEWSADYNPGRSNEYPELAGVDWSGEYDVEHSQRLRRERGPKWWVTERRDVFERFAQADVDSLSWFWAHPQSGQIYHFDGTHTMAATDPNGPIGLDVADFGGYENVDIDDFDVFHAAFGLGWVRSAYMPDEGGHPLGNQLALHGGNREVVEQTARMLLEKGLEVDHLGMRGEFDNFEFDGGPEELV